MIDKKVINSVYRIYSHVPKDINELQIDEMIDRLAEHHSIIREEGYLILNDNSEDSPFRKIPLNKIYGIVNFDKSVAIVLHTCILFFNVKDSAINIHLRLPKLSLMQRLQLLFSRKCD